MNPFSKGRISSIAYYSNLSWTIFCLAGTGFIFLKYGILHNGLIATVLISLCAFAVWSVPFLALVLLSFYVAPPEGAPPSVNFKDLLKGAIEQGSGPSGQADRFPGGAL